MNIMYRLNIPRNKEGIISYPREVELPLTSCPAHWIDEINDMVCNIVSDCYLIPVSWKFEDEPDYCWREVELPSMEYVRDLEKEIEELKKQVEDKK